MTTRSITRIRSPRRPRQWGITHSNGAIVAATQAGSLLVNLSAGVEASLGQTMANWTVSAIRFNLDFLFQATAVVGDRVAFAWGIILATADAVGAGATSLPDPNTDDGDWIAHGGSVVVADVAAVISAPRDSKIVIDNNSMRKVRENNSRLMLIIRATLLDDPISVFVSGRTLFLLR